MKTKQDSVKKSPRIEQTAIIVLVSCLAAGCHVPKPGGAVITPDVLGSKVDEINRIQEENAELIKFTIYAHEFEINLQDDYSDGGPQAKSKSTFNYQDAPRLKGIRLTAAGEDHVRQIAAHLNQIGNQKAYPRVVIQRSETSKKWETKHHYPVHENTELDLLRRTVVVTVMESLGVADAQEIVIVAPAMATGMSAVEATSAYRNAIIRGRGNRSGGSGNSYY
ncbi:MAG: hypothetical protein KDB00_18960 [Planctomycetales bacterium]|nr:hypothetical protein [Planctomycetales bacterium]